MHTVHCQFTTKINQRLISDFQIYINLRKTNAAPTLWSDYFIAYTDSEI